MLQPKYTRMKQPILCRILCYVVDKMYQFNHDSTCKFSRYWLYTFNLYIMSGGNVGVHCNCNIHLWGHIWCLLTMHQHCNTYLIIDTSYIVYIIIFDKTTSTSKVVLFSYKMSFQYNGPHFSNNASNILQNWDVYNGYWSNSLAFYFLEYYEALSVRLVLLW